MTALLRLLVHCCTAVHQLLGFLIVASRAGQPRLGVMLYGVTLPPLHPPLLPTWAFPSLWFSFICFFFSSLSIRHAGPGTSDDSSTSNLVLPWPWLPPSLSYSVSLSVSSSVCFSFPLPTLSGLFLSNLGGILVFYPLTSVLLLLLLLLIISALLIWFDNVPDLLTGIWLPWAWLVGNVLYNDKAHGVTEIKMHFFISRKLPANCSLSIEKRGVVTESENVSWKCSEGPCWCPDKRLSFV